MKLNLTKNNQVNNQIDDLLAGTSSNTESESETEENSFIDELAEEGEEDTPSDGSNDIIDHGEAINTTETDASTNDSYESDSFVTDEENFELLSGEEYDIYPKPSRILKLSSDSDTSIVKLPVKKKKILKKRSGWKRIVKSVSSSKEEEDSTTENSDSGENALERIVNGNRTESDAGNQNNEKVITASDIGDIKDDEDIITKKNEKIIILENISLPPNYNFAEFCQQRKTLNTNVEEHDEKSSKENDRTVIKKKKKLKKKLKLIKSFGNANNELEPDSKVNPVKKIKNNDQVPNGKVLPADTTVITKKRKLKKKKLKLNESIDNINPESPSGSESNSNNKNQLPNGKVKPTKKKLRLDASIENINDLPSALESNSLIHYKNNQRIASEQARHTNVEVNKKKSRRRIKRNKPKQAETVDNVNISNLELNVVTNGPSTNKVSQSASPIKKRKHSPHPDVSLNGRKKRKMSRESSFNWSVQCSILSNDANCFKDNEDAIDIRSVLTNTAKRRKKKLDIKCN